MNPECDLCQGTGRVLRNGLPMAATRCIRCNGTGYFDGEQVAQYQCKKCGKICADEARLTIHQGLVHFLVEKRNGAESNKMLSDGREATLYQTITTGRILVGPPGDLGGDEEYMFATMDSAYDAFTKWDGYGQPKDWIRWKVGNTTYRRGPNGEPYQDTTDSQKV